MSHSNDYWFIHVIRVIKLYPDGLGDSEQDVRAKESIREALEELRLMPDGELRVRLIELLYIKQTHTREGAALKCHISDATARRWSNYFVRIVAAKMGF